MNLIKWSNSKIEIAPEAYGIKVFKNIWNADRSLNKEKAIATLSTLYFMYDPRSEYQYIVDLEDRMESIITETGLPNGWKPDKLFNAAIPVYKNLTTTTSSLLLESNRMAVEKLRTYITDLNLKTDVDDKGKPIHTLNSVTASIRELTKLAGDISKAEKEIHKDIEEQSARMRGKGDKKIADDGFDFMEE